MTERKMENTAYTNAESPDHKATTPLRHAMPRYKDNSTLEPYFRTVHADVYSPPKRKRAQERVLRVRTFSNEGKLGVNELLQNPCIGGHSTPLLSEKEQQLVPQDLHERANKCSIVQAGSGCEALMKQSSLFDAHASGCVQANGIMKRRAPSPSHSFFSTNYLQPQTPAVGLASAATPPVRFTQHADIIYNMDDRRESILKQTGYSPFRTAASLESDDTQSPVSTPFRFTSFPASLPRISAKVAQPKSLDELPSQFLLYDQSSNLPPSPLHPTSTPRFVFSSKVSWDANLTNKIPPLEGNSSLSPCMEAESSSPNRARAVDVSRDSTISSVSTASPAHISIFPRQIPVHVMSTPLDLDPTDFHKVATGGDWNENAEEEDEEHVDKAVSGTRLNFNSLLSPEVGKTATESVQESDSTVLLRNNPVELKQTFSSDTQDYHQADTTNARNGVSWMQIDLNWSKSLEKEGNDDLFLASRQYFESQLESTQVSPIRLRGDSVELTHCSSLDYAADETQSTQTANFSSYKRDVNSSRMKNETLLIEKSLSSSSSSSPSGKPRKIRPMPDMSAFDGYSSSITKQADVRHSTSFSSLSTFVCPPTPMLKVARRLSQSLQSNKLLVDCNHNSIEGAGRAKDGKKLDTQVTMNPIFDVPQSSSAEDEFDADIANANFGYIEDKKNVAELNDHGISFNKDFINLGVLGSGAFADVFKVRCKTDGMLYAVKRRRRQLCSIRDRERALKEVRIMHHLQYNDTFHDRCLYILKLFKAWQEDGYFFCQTELCCRDNCQQLIHSLRIDWQVLCRRFPNLSRHFALHQDDFDRPRSTIIPESAIWKICHDVSAGLSHIHSCGIIHCDIKPCNIFFHYSDSEGCICRIGDFGLADISGSEEDGQEGDTAFMALELLSSNKKDASADIFSLGMTIYKLSTDSNWEPPSEGIRWREVRGELHDPELPSSRSRSLKNLVKCTISPNAKARPSANFILSNIDEVKSAGNSRNAFLEDYVRDVNQFESLCERQLAAAQKAALELRKTPTNTVLALHPNTHLAEVLQTPTAVACAENVDCRTVRR